MRESDVLDSSVDVLADSRYISDPPVLNKLGLYYESIRKFKAAKEFYLKASELGYSDALVRLGNMYEFNVFKLKEIDWESAAGYYHKAALLGNPKGLFNYANCLHHGHGVEQNHELAYWLFDQATKRGDSNAWFYVGLYHQEGIVVEKNIDEAEYYYEKGAAHGDPYCYANLGKIYADKGYGPQEAVPCYLDAISRGDALGYAGIAKLYEDGEMTGEKDKETAIKWYRAAVKNGYQPAAEELKRLDIEYSAKPRINEKELRLNCLFSLETEEWRENWLNDLRSAAFRLLARFASYDTEEFEEFSSMKDLERIGFITAPDRETGEREVRLWSREEYNRLVAPLEKKFFDPTKEWPDEIGPEINHWYLDKIRPEYIQYLNYGIFDPVDYKGDWNLTASLDVNGKRVRVGMFWDYEDIELYNRLIKMVEDHADEFDVEGSLQNPIGELTYRRKG